MLAQTRMKLFIVKAVLNFWELNLAQEIHFHLESSITRLEYYSLKFSFSRLNSVSRGKAAKGREKSFSCDRFSFVALFSTVELSHRKRLRGAGRSNMNSTLRFDELLAGKKTYYERARTQRESGENVQQLLISVAWLFIYGNESPYTTNSHEHRGRRRALKSGRDDSVSETSTMKCLRVLCWALRCVGQNRSLALLGSSRDLVVDRAARTSFITCQWMAVRLDSLGMCRSI